MATLEPAWKVKHLSTYLQAFFVDFLVLYKPDALLWIIDLQFYPLNPAVICKTIEWTENDK